MIEVISTLLANHESLFFDLGIIIVVAAMAAYFARAIRQPLVPAYIIAGLILGPIGLKIIHDIEVINNISEIGIMFLLFIVGLEMDLSKLKKVGWVTGVTGTLQVALTFLAGYLVAFHFVGFNQLNSIYTGLIVAFSSTMVVIKLLSDENQLSTLHGRLIIGILFMQDILVILALTIFVGADGFGASQLIPVLLKFGALVLIAYLVNRFIAFKVFRFSAKSPELLFIMAVAFCFSFALLAYLFGYSVAMGAFLGGITLANLPYHSNIIGRITPLKDFFAVIFFVALGLQLSTISLASLWKPLLILLALIVLIKPFIIMIILSLMGYDKRNAFATSILLAQISEFSLILALSVDNISEDLFTMTIILAIATIALTSYISKYELKIYNHLIPVLKYFEHLSKKHRTLGYQKIDRKRIILIGSNKMGSMFLRSLKKMKKQLLVIDFNPEIIEDLRERKIPSMYGDITNTEILKKINFKNIKMVISTVENLEDSLILLDYLKTIKSKSLTFMTANSLPDALDLYDSGADYVIIPSVMSGEQVAELLEKNYNLAKNLKKIKRQHLKHLLEMNADQE
jgi:Kef-type K+ transport system membrane component KefB